MKSSIRVSALVVLLSTARVAPGQPALAPTATPAPADGAMLRCADTGKAGRDAAGGG
jgi:hypothetical protein